MIYGPEQNDLVLQLRKHRISKVILAGISANLCTQAHLYEFLEQGFEVAVVRDATAAAKIPEGDAYLAALINFRFVANALWWTDEAVARIEAAGYNRDFQSCRKLLDDRTHRDRALAHP